MVLAEIANDADQAADVAARISVASGGRDGLLPERASAGGKRVSSGEEVVERYDFEDESDSDALTDIGDFLMARHHGKSAVIHDFAVTAAGGCYFLSIAGPAQICTGIFAALVDQGRHNSEKVTIEQPADHEGASIIDKVEMDIRIPYHAVGSMRHIRTPLNEGRHNLQHSLIYSELLRADYDYRHVERPDTLKLAEMQEAARKELQKALSRFVLIEDVERGETEEALALRWYGFLTRRVHDGLLQDWALPLWRYCVREKVGVSPLARLRGRAWLCEPDRAEMRQAVGLLGRDGKLPLPESMRTAAERIDMDALEGLRAARLAAAAAD